MIAAISTILLVLTPGLPLLLSVAWPVSRFRSSVLALAPWAAAPGLGLALTSLSSAATAYPALEVPGAFAGLGLALDPTGRIFLLLASVLWLVGGVFARGYHADDPHRDVFFGFFLLTMAGNLGLAVAADILSFYLFFIVMAFSAYGLVVHDRDEEAYRAGRVYIVLTLAGDVMILTGLFAIGAAGAGAIGFGTELEVAWQSLGDGVRSPAPATTATLLILGFGVKAGLVPLHVWLPLAHPVAPTVASALLSGAMIKAGVLAWIRYLPETLAFPALGGAAMVAGTAAAFYGVLMGLPQDEAKTVLAYSSVSQMGFMTVGIGVALRRPELAAVGFAAVAVYALHHGIAKGALFLSVGVVDRAPRWDRSSWRPVILLSTLLPVLAICGAPLTSGSRAKGAIKHALEELGGAWYHTIEPLLIAAAFGTTVLLARFLVVLDRRARDAERGTEPGSPWGIVVPWALLVALGPTALFWIHAMGPGTDLVPAILHSPLLSLLPVLAGALAGWAVYRRPGLLGPLRQLRIPPGDLLAPVERLLRRISLPSQDAIGDRSQPLLQRMKDLGRSATRAGQRLADADIFLTRGIILGMIVLLMVAVLVLATLG